MSSINIVEGGLFTTVQDKGRQGYQQFGVPVSGVMDSFSHRVSNILTGNDEYEAVLECTLTGPKIEFLGDCVIAITGGFVRIKGTSADRFKEKTKKVA